LAAVIYAFGLSGPFLLDDFVNLQPVLDWSEGGIDLKTLIAQNSSGPFGRPVAMLSFAGSAALFGTTSLGFKLGNLLLHLLIGIIVWLLAARLFALDARISARASLLGAIVAAVWLLHPLNVSTVLYAVQRMAQLSALFALLAVLAFMQGRRALEQQRLRAAMAWLFVGFPLLVLTGLLSKENAAVAVAICLAIEITLLTEAKRHYPVVRSFFAMFLILPALALGALLISSPDSLLGGYEARAFSMAERLLTQPRALLDYIALILVPSGPRMGLYTDDFTVSTGLLTPLATLIALALVTGATITALMARRKAPAIACGWLFFLAAHGVESTFLPLELHFEHRNYLPMVGILLAAVAGLAWLSDVVSDHRHSTPRLAMAMTLLALAVLSAATLGRVMVWGSAEAIARQGVRHNPESLRAHADLASWLTREGRHEEAIAVMVTLSQSERADNRVFGHLGVVTSQCLAGQTPDLTHLSRAVEAMQPRLTSSVTHAVFVLMAAEREGKCQDLSKAAIAETATGLLVRAHGQSPSSEPIWLMNYYVAKLHHEGGQQSLALAPARRAWVADRSDPPIGDLLVRLLMAEGALDEAERIALEVLQRLKPNDAQGKEMIEAHLDLIKRLRRSPTPDPSSSTPADQANSVPSKRARSLADALTSK
jgi:Flp pilus assembly protein TadD